MTPKKPYQAERAIQRSIKDYLAAKGFRVAHVPNGANLAGSQKQRAIQMQNLKGDGLVVGFPDLIVMADQGRVGFMEVKTSKGKQSESQIAVQSWMERDGHKYSVVRSVDESRAALCEWGWL